VSALPELHDRRLTHSRLACARTCLRKHYLLYELGLRPDAEAPPLRIGRVFHRGLELMAARGHDEAILEAVAVYDAGPPPGATEEETHAWWVERETVACLLAAHAWRWAAMDAEMEIIACEQVFELPLVNPHTGRPSRTWRLAGKRDRIVRLPDGRLAILEYKTASEDLAPESDLWKRLLIDSQISLYWLAARDAGLAVETVLYDVTRKPTIAPCQIPVLDADGNKIVLDESGARVFNQNGTPRQSSDAKRGWRMLTDIESPRQFGERLTADIAERPDYYFARREIPRLQGDLDEARYELWAWGKILRDCERYGRWPRNTGACNGFGRCVCWDLCTGGFDPADGIVPEGWMQVEDVHQELLSKEE